MSILRYGKNSKVRQRNSDFQLSLCHEKLCSFVPRNPRQRNVRSFLLSDKQYVLTISTHLPRFEKSLTLKARHRARGRAKNDRGINSAIGGRMLIKA